MRFVRLVVVVLLLLSLSDFVEAKKKKKSGSKSKKSSKKSKKSKKKKKKEPDYDITAEMDEYDEYGDENGGVLDDPQWHRNSRARKVKAWQLHKEAMDLAQKDKFEDSLPRFRAAVRLYPDSAHILNDLGVTEMRVKEYQKAKLRFLKAIELDDTYQMAKDNDKDIRKELGDEDYNDGLGDYPQEHKISDVPELDPMTLMEMSVSDDVENSRLLGDSPFVVRGAAEAWGWNITAVDFDYLVESHGHKNADYYPHNMLLESVKPLFSNLGQALEELTYSVPPQHHNYPNDWDFSQRGTYIQWNVDEVSWRDVMSQMNATLPEVYEDSHWTEKCFDTRGVTTFNTNLHWKMMLIGEEGAGMFNHKDVMRMASWQVQLQGRKLWHVCSPDQDSRMYKAGDVNWFQPDYERWPLAKKAKCFQTITEPGDSMYYPRDWWHQTKNLDDVNIAFSGSMVNNQCMREFTEEMRGQCGDSNARSHTVFNAEAWFCEQVEKCVGVWTDTYGAEDPVQIALREENEERKRKNREKKKAKREKKRAKKKAEKEKAKQREEDDDDYDGPEDEL